MATLDGYQPYGCGMTAQHAVQALWRAHGLTETLKQYTKIIEGPIPPIYSDFDSHTLLLWWNTANSKLYKGIKNQTLQLTVWFEI